MILKHEPDRIRASLNRSMLPVPCSLWMAAECWIVALADIMSMERERERDKSHKTVTFKFPKNNLMLGIKSNVASLFY